MASTKNVGISFSRPAGTESSRRQDSFVDTAETEREHGGVSVPDPGHELPPVNQMPNKKMPKRPVGKVIQGLVINRFKAVPAVPAQRSFAALRNLTRFRDRKPSMVEDLPNLRRPSTERLRAARTSQVVEIEAPQDLHFAVASLILDGSEISLGRKLYLAAWSFFTVLLSFVVLQGMLENLGGFYAICLHNEDCEMGKFCSGSRVMGDINVEGLGLCVPCPRTSSRRGSEGALAYRSMLARLCTYDGEEERTNATAATELIFFDGLAAMSDLDKRQIGLELTRPPSWAWPLNATASSQYADAESLCEACSYRGHFPYMYGMPVYHRASMRRLDWFALALVAIAVGIGITGEAVSISTTMMYIHSRRHDTIVRSTSSGALKHFSLCLFSQAECILWVQSLRIHMLAVIASVCPMIIMWDTADNASILLDGCALIFVLQIDNALSSHLLSTFEKRSAAEPLTCTRRQRISVERGKWRWMLVAMGVTLIGPWLSVDLSLVRLIQQLMLFAVIVIGWVNEAFILFESAGGAGRWARMIFRWVFMIIPVHVGVNSAVDGGRLFSSLFGLRASP